MLDKYADDNRYRVVFRRSTVVFDEIIYAKNIVKAARQAQKTTEDPDSLYHDWSVYSITLS